MVRTNSIAIVIAIVATALLAGCGGPPSLMVASPTSGTGSSGFEDRGTDATSGRAQNLAANGATAQPAAFSTGGNLRVVNDLPPPSNSEGGTLQFVSPNDVLDITVFGVESLNRAPQVDSTGRFSMPLIGEVTAAGKTERQLEEELEKRYGARYLQSPQITVTMKESASRRVTVDGEVKVPGIYPISADATLLRALALARGFSAVANPSQVYVFRQVGDDKYVANFDVNAIRGGKRRDPRVYGGDVVVVFSSGAKVAMQNLRDVLGLATSAGRLAILPY